MIARILLSAVLALATSVIAEPVKQWPFKVYLDDTEIGHHHFELLQSAAEQEIRSRARFDVKVLLLTVYSYRHENVEHWRGNCLASLASSTDDNGERVTVRADARGSLLRVQVNDRPAEYPADCAMSFAYWNPAFLRATRLLHPQTGELVDVQIVRTGEAPLRVGNQTIPAQRYTLRGPELRIDLFYSKQGEWLALDAPTKSGRTLRYRLDRLPGCIDVPAGGRRQETCA